MQTPPHLNDQHVWGGRRFRAEQDISPATTQRRTPREGRFHQREGRYPQGGVIASNSDSLFHPVLNDPVPSSYVYNLPDVPPRFRASHHSPFTRPLPYLSTFSSYNNPTLAIPPYNSYPPAHPLGSAHQMGPPPLPPFSSRPPPVVPQLQFAPSQPSYLQPPPAIDHHLPSTYSSRPLPPVPSISPSHLSTLISLPKTLPTVTHIPVLTSKNDFFPWDEGVHALIRANGLVGHILDPSAYVDPMTRYRTPKRCREHTQKPKTKPSYVPATFRDRKQMSAEGPDA